MSLMDYLRKSDPGILVRREYWRHKGYKDYQRIDDYSSICKNYKKRTGLELNLANPQRFYEKLNWMKLFYRPDLIRQCTDKYTVRNYVKSQGCENLLNKQYAAYKNVDEFFSNINALPSQFVVKASHGSGWNLIVKDKAKVNWFWWKRIMTSWMKQDASWFGREWNYATDDPRLVVEKYLEDETGQLRDYKVFCFNGKPEFIMLEEDRYTNHKRVFCDCKGNILQMNDGFGFTASSTVKITPIWNELLKYAEILSKPFPHVRVDFYICNGQLFFGEMTFYNDAGYARFYPDELDYKYGKLLKLPEPNYNLSLLKKLIRKSLSKSKKLKYL